MSNVAKKIDNGSIITISNHIWNSSFSIFVREIRNYSLFWKKEL